MASNSTSRVLRRVRPLAGSFRYYPYATGTGSGKEDMKEELVRLGVELSLSVVESMFLLCDDIHTMLSFCFKLWRLPIPPQGPVSERLIRVIHDVYSSYIKPKNRVYQDGGNSVQFELIRTTWEDFANGIIVLHRLVMLLRRKDCSFDDRLLSSAVAKYKQVLKKLEDKLRSAKDVSDANGFARETMEFNIYGLWKSLFDEDAGEATPQVIKIRIFADLFEPVMGKSWHSYADPKARETPSGLPIWGHREIHTLPICSPYILRKDFAKQELKEEVVQLGVELSLYVAESMFLLCDDIRSMLLFCNKLCRDATRDLHPVCPVLQRLLRVMYYVYTKYIKPKHGVYQNGGRSVQWRLTNTTWENFDAGIKDLDLLVSILRGEGSYVDGREFTSSVEKALKKIEEKLRCAKDVSEANGYARDEMESNILDLWKSLFDKETEEAGTLKVMRLGIICDMFSPLLQERAAKHYLSG